MANEMKTWKVEAHDDVVYVLADDMVSAEAVIATLMGTGVVADCTFTQVDSLPDGEELLNGEA
jgi:hypothetical protein